MGCDKEELLVLLKASNDELFLQLAEYVSAQDQKTFQREERMFRILEENTQSINELRRLFETDRINIIAAIQYISIRSEIIRGIKWVTIGTFVVWILHKFLWR